MPIIDQDVVRISLNFELGDGTLYQNIYHYIRDGSDPVSDQDTIDAISARFAAAYASIDDLVRDDVVSKLSFVDRVEFNEIEDRWAVVANIGTFTMSFTAAGAGEGLPFQCSPYIIFKTARPRTIGKKFLFPFTEAAQAETILTGGTVTAIVAMIVDLIAALELGGDATLTPGVPRTGFKQWFNFLVGVANDVLGTQRRRRPGVGA